MIQSKNHLPRIASQLHREMSRAVRETAFEIEVDWKTDVRVDTGTYRNSIQTRIINMFKAIVATVISYAVHNEFGTRFMEGRPSARTAADRAKAKFITRLSNIERSLR